MVVPRNRISSILRSLGESGESEAQECPAGELRFKVTSVTSHLIYDALGRVTETAESPAEYMFGYTGRERDTETGLVFYRARYYDPTVGRFMSEDPIGFQAEDANLFRYVTNQVTTAVDPTGLELWVNVHTQQVENFEGMSPEIEQIRRSEGWIPHDEAGRLLRNNQKALDPFLPYELASEEEKKSRQIPAAKALKSRAAWTAAMISRAGLAKELGPDGSKWNPFKTSYQDNRAILVKIYKTYAAYYAIDNTRFLWAGLASQAGSKVVHGALDMLERERLEIMHAERPPIGWEVQVSLRAKITQILSDMAKSIFLDITWQHEAYVGGGVPEINAQFSTGTITRDMRDAWDEVDSGDASRVLKGTTGIVKREQLKSLQEGYANLSLLGGGSLTGHPGGVIGFYMGVMAESGLPGVPKFSKAMQGNFASTEEDPDRNARWVWMRDYVIPAWGKLNSQQRDAIVKGAVTVLDSPAER